MRHSFAFPKTAQAVNRTCVSGPRGACLRMLGLGLAGLVGLAAVASALLLSRVSQSTHMVAMADGTRLATDVYLPAGADGPFPVILVRTPYNKSTGGIIAAQLARAKGYALVVQDLRGRFQSEGSDAPLVFYNDGWVTNRDGHDTLRWIAAQAWCNGNVATWGPSALGITQNMLAPDAPEVLKAQYVMVAFSDMYSQAVYQGGAFRKSLVETWLRDNKFAPHNLANIRAHPVYDALWEGLNPEAQAHRVNVPAVYYGGWYDIFLQGTINAFVAVQQRGGPKARGKCRLVIGPWAHGALSGLKYPPGSEAPPDALADAFRFFDHHLKGEPNGVAEDKPVVYYVMGDPEDRSAPGNCWRRAEDWPPPATPSRWYFHAQGRLAPEAPQSATDQRSYRYDPDNPVPTRGGQELFGPKGPMDQRPVESRPDVLVFTSDVLTEPLEVTGRITATLYVASDCPDTDFTVKLCDVYPDGRSMLVTDGILRARFRESLGREVPLQPGKIYAIEVDLWSTSLVFNRGHRLRVSVSSSNYPRFDVNPNTGQPFRNGGPVRVATNTVYLCREHPSHIVLPVPKRP